MPRFYLQFCVVVTFLCGLKSHAQAVQWQTIDGTSRYKVAYDDQSIRMTPLGHIGIWIRFIPRGEADRKSAAAYYKEKRYCSHLEYYEIDCSDQSAVLSLTDILGSSRVRLKRLQGSTKPDQILPGSVLENLSQQICPISDEGSEEENEVMATEQPDKRDRTDDSTLSSDKLQQIERLQRKTASKEASAETWKELGNIYFDTDQAELAIHAYDRALALRPNDTDILNDQGAMYRQTGNFERAVATFEKAFSMDPFNLESLYNSGYVYAFDLNDIPKALIIWRQYIKLDSESESARQVQSFIERYGK